MSQADDELADLINEITAQDERASLVSPAEKEMAEAELSGLDEGLKKAAQLDDWDDWKFNSFYRANRDRRIEVLSKWSRRRHPDGSVWASRLQQIERLHILLERVGR